jgi:hypothetical protein
MHIYPGDLRVFQLSRRSEVFVPGSAAEASWAFRPAQVPPDGSTS